MIETMIEQYGDLISTILGIISAYLIYLTWKQKNKLKNYDIKLKTQEEKVIIQEEKAKRQDVKLAEVLADSKNFQSLIEVIATQANSTARLALNINDMNNTYRESSQQVTTAINTMELATSQKIQDLDATITRFSKEIETLTEQLKKLPSEINQSHQLEHNKLNNVLDTITTVANRANDVFQKIEKSELKLENNTIISADKVEKGK